MRTFGLCADCGQIFKEMTYSLCSSCSNRQKQDYSIIREFLKHNPRSNAIDIANGTGISIEKITKFIKGKSITMYS